MPRCHGCSRDVGDATALSCPHCGAPLHDPHASAVGTVAARVGSFDPARFAPGHLFAGRYRIVSLLGRGAMGEVYRADDLRLQQTIALKLLATPAGDRDEADQRFAREVRLARGIAHPNVCHVYDIGDADGWQYLSMEYVDGETLASLLRRIGRLPAEKAIDIARQLCAGLAAAHDRGVLHRDLKPANIMVDGRGRIRIMDFGLAVPSDATTMREVAGTPGYMAPEQLCGARITEQTDLYALGLVLHELFVGRRFVAGERAPELDVDVADIIDRCVNADPAKRPPSASSIAARFPARGPIAAVLTDALAPPPGTAAAAATMGMLRPAAAWALLVAAIGGTLAIAAWGTVLTVAPSDLPKAPEVLAERSRAILTDIGNRDAPADSEFWFSTTHAAPGARSVPIRFVYRQSSRHLVPGNLFHLVTEDDPPADATGMASVTLNPLGHLVRVAWIREVSARSAEPGRPADWSRLFREAGLDQRAFVRAESDRTILVPHDEIVSWRRQSEFAAPATVTAASLGGAAVFFEVTGRESWPSPPRNVLTSRRPLATEALLWTFIVLAFASAGVLARRTLRAGEANRAGARRLATFIVCGGVLFAILRGHHVPSGLDEVTLVVGIAGWALVWASFSWLTYAGCEPYARRMCPATVISWNRVLAGRVRDPLVGRDVLTGLLAGMATLAVLAVRFQITHSAPPEILVAPALESIRSARHVIATLAFDVTDAVQFALGGLLFLILLRLIIRARWIADTLWVLLVAPAHTAAALGTSGVPLVWDVLLALALGVFAITILLRFGLLASAVALLVERLLTRVPMTLDPNAWYAGSSAIMLLIVVALACYGFVVALAGRPAFGGHAADSTVRRLS